MDPQLALLDISATHLKPTLLLLKDHVSEVRLLDAFSVG